MVETSHIPLIILNALILIVVLYLFIMFIKSKAFNNFSCYYMIIFVFIILIDNILRIIPINQDNICNTSEKVEGYFIVLFDKLILSNLSMQALISYLGILHTNFYISHEKCIFFVTLFSSIIIGVILSAIYCSKGFVSYGNYYYAEGTDTKIIIDTIYNAIYLAINFYCTLVILIFLRRKVSQVEKGLLEDFNYKHKFYRMLAMFIINNLTFVESYLIIYDIIWEEAVDYIYLVTCLIIAINSGFNDVIYKETIKLFCRKKYEAKFGKQVKRVATASEGSDDDDDNDELKKERTDSF